MKHVNNSPDQFHQSTWFNVTWIHPKCPITKKIWGKNFKLDQHVLQQKGGLCHDDGNFIDRILLKLGVPQGNIISVYIFIILVEILLIRINFTRNIKGTTFATNKSWSETFADDKSLFMERKDEYIWYIKKYLAEFYKISRLKCNISKTKVIPIGDFDSKHKICPDIDLDREDNFTLLGFCIDNKLEKLDKKLGIIDQNVINLINKC